MTWFLTIYIVFLISLTLGASSDASLEKNLQPKAVIVGKVYCETCLQGISKSIHFISGAFVGAECKDVTSSKPNLFQAQAKTDNQGVFRLQLPFSVSKDVTKIDQCSVKLIRSNDANCAVPSLASSSSLHLKPTKQGSQIFSSGFLTYKPSNQANLCNQNNNKKVTSSSLNDEKEGLAKPDFFFFPPNPLNPPSLLPPNPIIPSPAPLIPNPFQPPPAPLIPNLPPLPSLPPLPGLTHPPPPPPPLLPSLPPLPSFPFPPLPLIPGIPPAPPSP